MASRSTEFAVPNSYLYGQDFDDVLRQFNGRLDEAVRLENHSVELYRSTSRRKAFTVDS